MTTVGVTGLPNGIQVGKFGASGGVLFGPEVSTDAGFDNAGSWTLSNSSISLSSLTLSPVIGVAPATAALANSILFDVGEFYSVEYEVVQTGNTMLYLSASGFTPITEIPTLLGHNRVVVQCTIEDGRIRLATDFIRSDIIVLNSFSIRKVTPAKGVIGV